MPRLTACRDFSKEYRHSWRTAQITAITCSIVAATNSRTHAVTVVTAYTLLQVLATQNLGFFCSALIIYIKSISCFFLRFPGYYLIRSHSLWGKWLKLGNRHMASASRSVKICLPTWTDCAYRFLLYQFINKHIKWYMRFISSKLVACRQ